MHFQTNGGCMGVGRRSLFVVLIQAYVRKMGIMWRSLFVIDDGRRNLFVVLVQAYVRRMGIMWRSLFVINSCMGIWRRNLFILLIEVFLET